ncbi:flagellar hook protein FlgE [Cycloclasticus sp.]|uniref:flagellar hook protein FlgE n=1 Tax=Cycloclasticus sp. TaxID=2024830 RepID=UPI000C11D45E|nr:flagellar hook protein FlgE [Cycloclasticus sp.]PHR48466.1 MAG: flagellar hook protein FlgE [Cycloclasticus sp.]
MSFRTSLSGLDASATDLSVIGNNIANASTNGFKESRTEFADVFATSFTGVSGNTPGSGVRVASVSQQFGQGNVEFTSSSLDLAINGDGFFVLSDNGTNVYTRAGAYSTDKDGFVVDSSGRQLQTFPTNGNGTFNTGNLTSLQLSTGDSAPSATTSVEPTLNLDSKQAVPTTYTTFPINPAEFSATDAGSYNHSTSTTVFDSLGNDFPATMYYVASDPSSNEWQVHTYVDGNPLTLNAGANDFLTMTFDSLGSFQSIAEAATPTSGNVAFDALPMSNGAANLAIDFDYSGTTQYGGDFAVNSLSQDGFASGRLSGISVDETGIVSATFTNGQSTELGQVALATFPNSHGLRQLGDTSWADTFAAGDRVIGSAGTAGFGSLQSGALEASNVDIATELVSLITAQRNFQANAQAISTENEIQTAIINIR